MVYSTFDGNTLRGGGGRREKEAMFPVLYPDTISTSLRIGLVKVMPLHTV